MSLTARQELTSSLRTRYQQASYQEKQRILDEYVAVTGYHRKAAIRILRAEPKGEKKQRIWQVKYDAAVKVVLEQVWQIANRICGKRLVPLLKELIPALEKFGHLELEPEVREKVLALSPATADRLLREIRKKEKRSKGTTRRGKLLKSQVPLRTFAEWEEVKPGFLEADAGGALWGQCEWTISQHLNIDRCRQRVDRMFGDLVQRAKPGVGRLEKRTGIVAVSVVGRGYGQRVGVFE